MQHQNAPDHSNVKTVQMHQLHQLKVQMHQFKVQLHQFKVHDQTPVENPDPGQTPVLKIQIRFRLQ